MLLLLRREKGLSKLVGKRKVLIGVPFVGYQREGKKNVSTHSIGWSRKRGKSFIFQQRCREESR